MLYQLTLFFDSQVLELSNARRALSALIEQDADGYTITAAIEHARRVGVDAEVRSRAAFQAEAAMKTLWFIGDRLFSLHS